MYWIPREVSSGKARYVKYVGLCCSLADTSYGFSAKAGTQVIVPYREEDEKRHLKVMGDLGQIVPMVCFRLDACI